MNQLVAFFAPTALPNAAGAVARAANAAAQGDSFASLLAQFQTAVLNNDGVDSNAQPSKLLPQLPTGLPQASDTLSTEDLVAKLEALAGTPAGGDATKIDATLALLDPASSAAPQTPVEAAAPDAASADTALAALLATLPFQTQAQPTESAAGAAPPTPTTPPVPNATPAALGLRGTLAAEQAPSAKPADGTQTHHASETAVEHATAPVALLTAIQRPKGDTQPHNANPVAVEKRATPQTPNGNAPSQPPTPQQSAASAESPAPSAVSQDATVPSHPGAGGASSVPPKPADTASPQPTQPGAAVPAQMSPTLVDARQMNAAVIATPQAAVPLDALAVHIARKFDAGVSQFEIRLHPAELGQLDISLSVAEDGRIQAVLRAERPETLDILQRDARTLEQQLRQAGLEVGSNSLSFSLSSGNGQRQAPHPGWPAFADAQDAAVEAKQEAASTYIAVRQRDGIDIRV